MKKAALMILALVLCMNMSGCLGAVQADDYIYVVGIGFDLSLIHISEPTRPY